MTRQVPNLRIGIIGLGNMGHPIASRLQAEGFSLVLHEVNKQAAHDLLQSGATWAENPTDLAKQVDIVCTVLPGPIEAEAVFFGENGLSQGMLPGTLLIDFTTNSTLLVRNMHQALAGRGITMLDAPMSGGVEGAKKGELTLIVGGDTDALEKAAAVFNRLAKTVIHAGDIGAGSICKTLHNCVVFCANLATIECLTVGIKAGVDAATLIDVFQKSGLGRNLDLQVAMPATLFQGKFIPARFAMQTARKDMGLATELAHAMGIPMQLAEICERDMEEAIKRGWGKEDNTAFLRIQEERAGVQVRPKTNKDLRTH